MNIPVSQAPKKTIWRRLQTPIIVMILMALSPIIILAFIIGLFSIFRGWAVDPRVNSTPFLGLQPTVREMANKVLSDGADFRYKQSTFGGDSIDWNQAHELTRPFVEKYLERRLGQVETTVDKTLTDKRVFLVSIKPAIVLFVPHIYVMENHTYLNYKGDVQPRIDELYKQISAIEDAQGKIGIHPSKSFQLAWEQQTGGTTYGNYIEISTVFPNMPGIEVGSETWEGFRMLNQVEIDASFPFKTVQADGAVGFKRLVLKDSGKTSP